MPLLWHKLNRNLIRARMNPDDEESDLGGVNEDFKTFPQIRFRGLIQNFRRQDVSESSPEGETQKDKYVLYCNTTASEQDNTALDFLSDDRITDADTGAAYRVDDSDDDGGQNDHFKVSLVRFRPQTKIRLPDSGGD